MHKLPKWDIKFYSGLAWSGLSEEFEGAVGAVSRIILYPFFVWIMAKLWEKYGGPSSAFAPYELIFYIGVTEAIFLVLMQQNAISRAMGDFSLSLARPRAWLPTIGSLAFGKTLGKLFLNYLVFICVAIALTGKIQETILVSTRLLMLLPIIALLDSLYVLFFAIAQVRWAVIGYLRHPLSRLFLVLGGVFIPLNDVKEPLKSIFLNLPFSDIIFQAAHFAIRGEFYAFSYIEWFLRIFVQISVLLILSIVCFKKAVFYHQSFGG